MTGREIRETLDKANVLPSRQLGQNFLVDPNMARWIVSQLDAKPEDAVLEVGPGTGALTEHLVGKVRRLILVEFDPRLAAALQERFQDDLSVEVHHADGARFDPRVLYKHRPLKFLGNLPYSSGGAIMKNLLSQPHPFERAVVMLQKEVVDRMCAGPGTKEYGILSLRMQMNWEINSLRTVPPEAFFPRPKIDSSVALLRPRTSGLPPFDSRLLDELLRRGFSQRRKQLRKQLPDTVPWEEVCTALDLAPTVRAEEISLVKWVEISRIFDTHPLKDLPQKDNEIFNVVDENDTVIRQATRAEVHANNLLHRAVHVLVFNKRGEVLLQKRSQLKDRHPGVWDSSVSGHLDAGEDYASAAFRELAEEMDIHDASVEKAALVPPSAQTGWEHIQTFRANYDGKVRFPAAEVDSAIWFPIDEINGWIQSRPADFSSGFLVCWQAMTKADCALC